METCDANYILINYGHANNQYTISSKHNLLKTDKVKVIVFYDHLVISRPDIDYRGKTFSVQINKNSNSWRYFAIVNENIIPGKFDIDEQESSEDEIVVFFK